MSIICVVSLVIGESEGRLRSGSYFSRIILALVAAGLVLVCLGEQPRATAATGINKTLNLQGRLLTSAGAIVPDGSYNFRIRIYQDGDGVLGGGDETLKWTELWQNAVTSGTSAPVVIKNGYFSINLATFCSFAGGSCQGTSNTGVDFNQDTLWASLDVGGTSVGTSPTYDGEMTPFRRLSSAVYALQAENANTLGGLSSAGFIQNTTSVQAGANVYVRSAATGSVVSVLEGANGQTADLLDLNTFNGTTSTTVAKFTAAGNLQVAASIDTVTGTSLAVGGTNATSVVLGKNSSTTSTTVQSGSGGYSITSTGNGSITANGSITVTAGGGSTWSTSAGNLIVQAGGTDELRLQTGGAGIVALGDQNTTTLRIGRGSNIARTIDIGTAGSSQTQTISIGSVGGSSVLNLAGATTVTGRTTGDALTVTNSTSTGNVLLLKDNATAVLTVADGGATSLQNSVDSTSALVIQNAAGMQAFKIDTTADAGNLLTNGSIEVNTTGWAVKGAGSISRVTSTSFHGVASLSVTTTATANDGVKFNLTLAASTQYTVNFMAQASGSGWSTMNYGYAADGSTETDCKTAQNPVTAGFKIFTCTFTTPGTISGTPYFYIKQTDATVRTFYLDALQLRAGSSAGVYRETAATVSSAVTSAFGIQPSIDSSLAFNIESADGSTLVAVDSVNKRFGIGTQAPSAYFHVARTTSNDATVMARINTTSTQTGDLLQFFNETASAILTRVGGDAELVVKPRADLAAVFQVLNAAGNQILTVDTSGSNVIVGKPGASGVTGNLQFANATNANLVTVKAGTTGGNYALTLPTALGSSGDCLKDTTGAGVLGFGTCGSSTTLQGAYDSDVDGSDAIIALTTADDSIILRNPSSAGTDSTYVLTVDQLATGATGGLSIQSAGTGNLLLITDTTATARDVLTVANGGATTFRNQTNSTSALRVTNATASTSLLNIDTTNTRIGINATTPGTYSGSGLVVLENSGYGFTQTNNGATIQSTWVGNESGLDLGSIGTETASAFGLYTNNAKVSLAVLANGNVNIGRDNADFIGTNSASLQVRGTGSGVGLFKVTDTTGADFDVLSIANEGATTLKNRTNSTTAFQIQNSSAASLFAVDSTNSRITLLGSASKELTWATDTSLPSAVQDAAIVASGNYIYVIGGANGASSLTSVYYAKVNSDGSLGSWQTGATLNNGRSRASAAVVGNQIVVMGGSNTGGTLRNDVEVSRINADGSLDSWRIPSLALLNKLAAVDAKAFVNNGNIYTVGGLLSTGSGATETGLVQFASSGDIYAPGYSSTSIAAARRNGGLAVWNNYVYWVGGYDSGGSTAQTAIYYAPLYSDGTIGTWTTASSPLGTARAAQGVGVVNGTLYVYGGDNGGASGVVYYAALNADGSVGSWSTAGSSLPNARKQIGAVTVNGHMYAIGGNNGTTTQTSVYRSDSASATVGSQLIANSGFVANGSASFNVGGGANQGFSVQNATTGATILSANPEDNALRVGNLRPAQHARYADTASSGTVVNQLIPSGYGVSYVAVDKDSSNKPYFAYVEDSSIKYGTCDFFDNCTTPTSTVTVAQSQYISNLQMVLGADDFGRITYVNLLTQTLVFIQCTNTDCSTKTTTTIAASSVNASSGLRIAADGFARISYQNSSLNLVFVQCTNASCSTKVSTTVDSNVDVGQGSHIEMGADGFARIGYVDGATPQMKFIQCTNADCSTRNTNALYGLYTVTSGSNISFKFGGDGFPRVAIMDTTIGWVRYLKCADAACSSHTDTVIDGAMAAAGLEIFIGTDGFPQILYDKGGYVYVARCIDDTCVQAKKRQVGRTTVQGIAGSFVGLVATQMLSTDNVMILTIDGSGNIWHLYLDVSNDSKLVGSTIGSQLDPFAEVHAVQGAISNLRLGDALANPDEELLGVYTTGGSSIFSLDSLQLRVDANVLLRSENKQTLLKTEDFNLVVGEAMSTTSNLHMVSQSRLLTSGIDVYDGDVDMASDTFARIGYIDNTNGFLKFFQCNNITCSSPTNTTVENTISVAPPIRSIVAADDFGRMLYTDSTNATLKLAQCTNAACSASTKTTVDSTGDMLGYSLAMGSDAFPRILFGQAAAATKFLQCTNASCSTKNTTTVEAVPSNSTDVAMAADTFGRLVYYDTTNTRVRFVQCTNASCSTNTKTTLLTQADYAAVRIRMAADGFARIAAISSGKITYIQCTNAACSTNNTTVVRNGDTVYPTQFGFRLGSDNFGRIAFNDSIMNLSHVLTCTNAACSTSNDAVIETNQFTNNAPMLALTSANIPVVVSFASTYGTLNVSLMYSLGSGTTVSRSSLGSSTDKFGAVTAITAELEQARIQSVTNSTTALVVQNANSGSVFAVDTSGSTVGINLGSGAATADLSFGVGNRTINVLTQTTANTAGSTLTVVAAAGNGTGAGGALQLNGGAAGGSAGAAGGGVTIAGAAGFATGTGGDGGAISLTGGAANGSGARVGGNISITAGANSTGGSGAAGTISITGGASSHINAGGGAVTITTGAGFNSGGSIGSLGSGNLTLQTGTGGTGAIGGTAGKVTIQGGAGGGASATGGGGGAIEIFAGDGAAATGNGGVGGNITIRAGSAGNSNANAGNILINPGVKNGTGTNGVVTVRPQTGGDGNNVFMIQNAFVGANAQLLLADTTIVNLIANSSAETDATNWAITTGSGSAPASSTSQKLFGNASLSINTSATANAGSKYNTTTLLSASTTYSLSFYAKIASGSFTVEAGRSDADTFAGESGNTCTLSSTSVTTTWTRFTCTFTTSASVTTGGYVFIRQSDSTSRTWFVDGVQLEQAAAPTNYREGKLQLNGTITAPTTFQNQENTTAAFQVQNAAGVLMLSVDTVNARLYVGPVAGDTVGTLIVLGNKTNSGDPTGVNGAMYYNSSNSTFRCYQNGTWVGCIGGLLSSNTATSTAISNTTTETNFDLTYSMPANYCVQGRVIRWTASGTYSTTGTPTLILKMKAGTTALATSPTLTTASGVTNRQWTLNGQTICNTVIGAAQATETQGVAQVFKTTTTADPLELVNTGTTTLNTNTAQTLQLSATWGTASPSNTITLRQFVIEGIGPQ